MAQKVLQAHTVVISQGTCYHSVVTMMCITVVSALISAMALDQVKERMFSAGHVNKSLNISDP